MVQGHSESPFINKKEQDSQANAEQRSSRVCPWRFQGGQTDQGPVEIRNGGGGGGLAERTEKCQRQ